MDLVVASTSSWMMDMPQVLRCESVVVLESDHVVMVFCPRLPNALNIALLLLLHFWSIYSVKGTSTPHVQSIHVCKNAHDHVDVVNTKYCLTPNPNAKQP